MITKKYYKLVKVSYADSDYFRVTNVDTTAGTLTIRAGDNLGQNLEYSTDGVNWTTADSNAPFSLSVPAGANVYMRGTNSTWDYRTFNMDVNHTIGGNYLSIINKTNYSTMTSCSGVIARQAFYNDSKLIDASELNFGNVTTLSNNGSAFASMFEGCTSLISAPELPFITTNMIDSSVMSKMFKNCTSLTKAPSILKLSNLAFGAFNEMFSNCTSLTTGPEIAATTSNGYPFTSMFNGCSSLTSVKIHITTWNTNASNWLKNVSASGTIYAPTGSDIANYSGTNGVPSGWTVVYY